MAKNSYILKNVEDFALGAFENTAMQDGAVHLGSVVDGYVQSGSYTSAVFALPPFTELIPCWSATTPLDTWVEVKVRLASTKGGRSRWFSFGKWSPFFARASAEPLIDDCYVLEAERLAATNYSACPNMAQVRVELHSKNKQVSPSVNLLGITTQSYRQTREDIVACEKKLEIPAYSCLVRDPSIAGRIPSVTALTMLLNRWGEDLLPEEVARVAYDQAAGRYGNLSFLSAAGGAYGYACEVHYAGINFLKAQVRAGYAVGAILAYSVPNVHQNDEEETQSAKDKPPVWEKAVAGSNGHMVAVCGFFTAEDGTKMLRMHNPLVHTNEDVRCELPVEEFMKYYLGIAFTAQKGDAKSDEARPLRFMGRLRVDNNEISLHYKLRKVFPNAEDEKQMFAAGTVCYTLSGQQAWASAAQKQFYYPALTDGKLMLDANVESGQRLTLYCISPFGVTWVGEKSI